MAGTNDLIYVPRDQSEMKFVSFAAGGRTFCPAEQAAAFDAYINRTIPEHASRPICRTRGALLPMVHRLDFSIAQNAFVNVFGQAERVPVPRRHRQLDQPAQQRLGRGQRTVATSGQVLTNPSIDNQRRVNYRLRTVTAAKKKS